MTNHEHLPIKKGKTQSTLDSLVLLEDLHRVGGRRGMRRAGGGGALVLRMRT